MKPTRQRYVKKHQTYVKKTLFLQSLFFNYAD